MLGTAATGMQQGEGLEVVLKGYMSHSANARALFEPHSRHRLLRVCFCTAGLGGDHCGEMRGKPLDVYLRLASIRWAEKRYEAWLKVWFKLEDKTRVF